MENFNRKLATVQKITSIEPIEGKDRIELAHVLGWQVIVKKDEFKPNDLCIFIEPDSVLPERPEYEFLRSKNFRIKTIKMGGVLSQGICFPLGILPVNKERNVGDDVTNLLGIKKYEPYIPEVINNNHKKYPKFLMRYKWFRRLVLRKEPTCKLPEFIIKTDEVRIQNIPNVVEDKELMIATEKVEGQSGSYALQKYKTWYGKTKYRFIVGSRNIMLRKEDDSSYWYNARQYKIEEFLRKIIANQDYVIIQGECVGRGIQGNIYNIKDFDLYIFNVIFPNRRLGTLEAKALCEAGGLKFVPIVNDKYILPDTVNEVLSYADGKSMIADTEREGLVIRNYLGTVSFKAVSPEYLVKKGL